MLVSSSLMLLPTHKKIVDFLLNLHLWNQAPRHRLLCVIDVIKTSSRGEKKETFVLNF